MSRPRVNGRRQAERRAEQLLQVRPPFGHAQIEFRGDPREDLGRLFVVLVLGDDFQLNEAADVFHVVEAGVDGEAASLPFIDLSPFAHGRRRTIPQMSKEIQERFGDCRTFRTLDFHFGPGFRDRVLSWAFVGQKVARPNLAQTKCFVGAGEVPIRRVHIVIGFGMIGDFHRSPCTQTRFDEGAVAQAIFGLDFEHGWISHSARRRRTDRIIQTSPSGHQLFHG